MDKNYRVEGFNWDARELYLKEAVGRAHLVLDANKKQIGVWHESLCDFFDWTACVFEEDKEKDEKGKEKLIVDILHQELEQIEKLVYGSAYKNKEGKKIKFTEEQRIKNKEQAYDRMRKVFRKINLAMWKKGLYVPKKKKRLYEDAINDV